MSGLAVLVFSAALAAAQTGSSPTPGQAIGVANAINGAELEAATLAEARALNPDVKAYARQILADHTRLNQELRAAGANMGVAPQDTPESAAVEAQGRADFAALRRLYGPAFERAYAAREVAANQAAYNKLDQLEASSSDPQLSMQLQEARSVVSDDLADAQRLQSVRP